MAYLKKSPWIIHYDASSCNGCDIEVLACLTPMYDVERFGIINTGNPKHADIFVVTGSVNEQNKYVIKNIYDQMPDPKVVVADRHLRHVRGGLPGVLQRRGRDRHDHPGGRVRARLCLPAPSPSSTGS